MNAGHPARHVPVLVVGGGPVGLSLGGDLAWRGQEVLLVEERTAPTDHPKATLLGARSMELFRRWGLDDAIYARALPADFRYAIVFCTTLAGHEMLRVESPSIAEVRARDGDAAEVFPELAWSPYGKTQIGQQALEPVLIDFARSQPGLELRHGWRFETFADHGDHVTATLAAADGSAREIVTADYLVACDGGASAIRKALGIPLHGRGKMRANVSFFFRAPDFLDVHGKGVANLYFVFLPGSFGVFTAIDGRELWNYQFYYLDPSRRTDDLDAAAILHRAVGRPFDFELLHTTHWHHHQSVAERWRAGRVFLAGDAAHLFSPTGGVGMNTGIGDAADLAWKLDAALRGWGGDWLLESYEWERKPVAWRNSVRSANNSDAIDLVMAETPETVAADTGAGDAARALVREKLRWMSQQFASAGVHLGYRYAGSPICVPDGAPQPPDDFSRVTPSTWPGSRAPHVWRDVWRDVWRAGGASTLDWFGRGFVLLCLGDDAAAPDGLVTAAAAAGLPLEVVTCAEPAVTDAYERRYVLVRPDGHVAWRGDAPPADAATVIDRCRGAHRPPHLREDSKVSRAA